MGTLLGMNTMDIQEFAIPVASFDLQLLPPEAREVGSTEFQDAVIRYFVNKYVGGNKTAIVTVDDENIQVVAFPASVHDPMNLALGMLNNGKIKEALPLLESLARQRKDDAELFYNLGIAYSELGEYQNAVMRLKRCVDIDPRHANAFVGLGVAYQRLQQSQFAIANLQQALALAPDNGYALRNLGSVMASGGDYAGAVPYLRSACAALPADPSAVYGLAQCLEAIGGPMAFEESDQLYLSIIQRFPGTQFDRLAREARTERAHKALRAAGVSGLRPDVIFYIAGALDTFNREGDERTRQIASEIAILGMSGLDINDPDQKYTLRTLPGSYSGLHLVSMMYTGFKLIDPTVNAGIDFAKEYDAALAMRGA